MPTYPLTHIPTNCSPPPPLTPLSSHTCHPRPAPTQAPRDQPPHPLPACPLIPPHMHAHPILPHRTPLHTVTHTHTPSIITLPTPTLTSPRTATHIHSPSHQLVAADLLVPACPHATSGRQLRSVGRGMLRQQAGVCSVQKAGDRAPSSGSRCGRLWGAASWLLDAVCLSCSHARKRVHFLFLQGANPTRGLCPHHPKAPLQVPWHWG